MTKAFYITAAELAQKGKDNIPDELFSAKHLILQLPCNIGVQFTGSAGFGVKEQDLQCQIRLCFGGSCLLWTKHHSCSVRKRLRRQIFPTCFLTIPISSQAGTSIKIPKAVEEVCQSLDHTPSAVMICITCVDALGSALIWTEWQKI